uniref:C-type lectin domain-containing protein n=1 Tax=Clytia hemisphaerica TaxID=252671 RepID=A0A7M5VAR4_9CNID
FIFNITVCKKKKCNNINYGVLFDLHTVQIAGSSKFYVRGSSMTFNFNAGNQFCLGLPGRSRLFIPRSAEEHDAVISKAIENQLDFIPAFWIGLKPISLPLTSPVTSNQFIWLDDSALTFDRWAPNEPTDDVALKAVFYDQNAAGWANFGEAFIADVLCEIDSSSLPLPAPLHNDEKDITYFTTTFESPTWHQAKAQCEEKGLDLVTFRCRNDNLFLSANLAELRKIWIGLISDTTPGKFRWINGDKSPYRKWCNGVNPSASTGCVVFSME